MRQRNPSTLDLSRRSGRFPSVALSSAPSFILVDSDNSKGRDDPADYTLSVRSVLRRGHLSP
jgi:hypothetical protein